MRTDTGKRRGVALPHVYASWFVPADDLLLHQERAVSALLTPFCCSPRLLGTGYISILLIIVPSITSMEGWVLKGCVCMRYALR